MTARNLIARTVANALTTGAALLVLAAHALMDVGRRWRTVARRGRN